MGSIFTYESDPPKVSSPWLLPEDMGSGPAHPRSETPQGGHGMLSDYGVTKLVAEPQDGPTEYKLHLLLRPRRTFLTMSTNETSEARCKTAPPVLSSSSQTRQSRLQHLTTQLLWRLQQSSPFHSTTSKDLVLPQLPDDSVDLDTANITPGKLIPGLEESRGALYEIGVSDDGTLVGLTKDEMDESIATLRVMAASLGCRVDILRTVIVGDCEWAEGTETELAVQKGKLWVVEALVQPDLRMKDASPSAKTPKTPFEQVPVPSRGYSTTDQLRITLTGPTTSGKSTLLGTLSSGTLDNGRGMSRISMLRHRHEVASGVTSSVSQELVGYKDNDIFNYSHGNIESWVDIHDCAEGGRLVFMSDSGGHPRFRRTVLRGLVGWDPHWTVLCIAGNDGGDSSPGSTSPAQDALGIAARGIDFAQAHLELCLTLKIPLAVVVTKLDLATKATLQRTIGKVLTSVKSAGRTPRIIQPDQKPHPNLQHVPKDDHAKVKAVVDTMGGYENALSCVPILLTSAVKGTGIGLMHALLESLPLPPTPTSTDHIGMALNPEQPQTLFHIDDTFTLPLSYSSLAGVNEQDASMGIVVSGYLRFGSLSVGDKVVVGPFPSEDDESGPSTPGAGLSISHPSSSELARIAMNNSVSASTIKGQWHNAQIVSVRNLRLPVISLEAGQVGSIGILFNIPLPKALNGTSLEPLRPTPPRIRKGMVLAIPSSHMIETGLSLQAASNITASFTDTDARFLSINSLVNVYVASVAAVARIQNVTVTGPSTPDLSRTATEDIDDVFRLSEQLENSPRESTESGGGTGVVQVSLELLNHREWIEMGSRILVLEGGRQDKSGLDGFLGKVVEIFD